MTKEPTSTINGEIVNTESVDVSPPAILAMAVKQGADLEKLEKLMDLRDRWEDNEARKAYIVAMTEFKNNPPEIFKDKHVEFDTQKGRTEYDHATIGNVVTTISNALAQHRLSHRWDVEQLDGGQIKVTCIITHALGHSESVSMQSGADPSGGKNNIQAIGSTTTYLQRYTLLAATGLAAKDMDDDGRGSDVEYISEDEALAVHAKLTDNDIDINKFIAWLKKTIGADSIEAIQSKALPDVVRMIDTTIKKKAKK